ncbi:MAG: DUF2283 domain-containing protein [Prosthecobacter sp.]|uniref:DUF2283 domain-containing protein n=1 Tax=Prosthecobacter sp. TaxID=1965333 RepID=UPI00263650DE|nr:DUF2283 domain-containing protein [Prosthecobacter sp.]MCF7789562.1 DUF2283 domain-containing protein [Prosthecobacter sp.]
MNRKKKIIFTLGRSGEAAYVKIGEHTRGQRKVAKNIRIHDLIAGYQGADVILDFDSEDRLLGIEILAE